MKYRGISTMIRYLQVKIDKILIIHSKFISRFLSFLRTNVILFRAYISNILCIDSKNLSRYIINLELLRCIRVPSRWILFPSVFFSFPLRGNMKNIGIHVISPRAVYSRRETVSQIYAADRECFLATVSSYTW